MPRSELKLTVLGSAGMKHFSLYACLQCWSKNSLALVKLAMLLIKLLTISLTLMADLLLA